MLVTISILADFIFLSMGPDASAYWQEHKVPGRYDGKDASGNRICLGIPNETCFTIYIDNPGQPPSPSGGTGSYTCVALWDATAGEGFVAISSINWTAVSGGYSWNHTTTTSVL